mgnify:CR=1 FL=1
MAKIAVLYCKKVKDHSCVACAKCYKGMAEKNGEYGRHDESELVAMTDCGDCPGLVVTRVKLLTETLAGQHRIPKENMFIVLNQFNSGTCPSCSWYITTSVLAILCLYI